MIDLDALLLGVLHHPADDVARLIYADALDESGVGVNAVRAEAIRRQVAGEQSDRVRQLSAEWLADWFGRPVTSVGGTWWAVGGQGELDAVQVKVTAGFISSVATHGGYAGTWTDWTAWRVAEAFAASVEEIFADHPLERIAVDLDHREDWWIAGRDGGATWTAVRDDNSVKGVVCHSSVGRSHFAAELRTRLRDRMVVLAAVPF